MWIVYQPLFSAPFQMLDALIGCILTLAVVPQVLRAVRKESIWRRWWYQFFFVEL